MPAANLLLCLFGLVTLATAKVEPSVDCIYNSMMISFKLDETNVRHAYLQNLKDYPDEDCQFRYGPSASYIKLELSLKDEEFYKCGLTRVVNKITGKKIFYHSVVVELKDDTNGTKTKDQLREIVHVKCSVTKNTNHTILRRNVWPAGFKEPEDLEITSSLETRAPEPMLSVGVRQNGELVTGELNVSPGTPLQMEIFLDRWSAPIYGLLVTHMQVTDTKTQEETIIFNGCSVDPYLFENFNTVDGDFLTAKFRAFKFPESTYVLFRGTVNVCLDKCRGIECSDGQIGYGRRRRALPTLPADPNKIFEITITSFIKVNYEDESENFEELLKNQTTMQLNNKKLIVGNEMTEDDNRLIKTIEERPSNLISEEILYSAIIPANSCPSNQQMSLVVNGLLLTLIVLFY